MRPVLFSYRVDPPKTTSFVRERLYIREEKWMGTGHGHPNRRHLFNVFSRPTEKLKNN